jgi:hypothetical protein
MSALTTPTNSNPREKKKKRNSNKRSKAKEQDHLKKTSLGPLRQGQRLDTSETKPCSSKERKPPTKARKPQRAPPAHMQAPLHTCKPPWTNATPPGQIHANHLMKQSSCISSALTCQIGHPHRSDRWTRSPSTWELHRLDRCPSPVRPMPPRKLPELKNSSKPLGNLLNACSKPFQPQTSLPCWQCMNQAKMQKKPT